MMLSKIVLLYFLLAFLLTATAKGPRKEVRLFPEGFQFGAATSSYQVEGGWTDDGKAIGVWDSLTHTHPEILVDHSNATADVSADSYHHVKRDVEIMRELGLDFYKFSISWSRLLPSSFPNLINKAGAAYYNNLIDEMLKNNIQPVVTIYHSDLPLNLQDMGGWANPYIIQWYSDYARVVFKLFGDRVKKWITMNEPREFCVEGFSIVTSRASNISGISEYICSKNVLLAHAAAWHIYNDEFRPSQGGQIGITFSANYYFPAAKSNQRDADRANEFHWGWFIHPIFGKEGNYPLSMIKQVTEKSASQGFTRSRMPALSPEEVVSQGFYRLLTQIRRDYDNPPVYIYENGYPTQGDSMIDDDRIKYMREYLSAMLDAIEEGSDIRSYTYWSLIDSFEWAAGYSVRFGLYNVNMTDPARPRTPRKSAFVYKHILRTRTLDLSYEPDTNNMTIDDGR